MRLPFSGGFPRLIPLMTTVVVLGSAAVLGLRPAPDFGRRDAFVASLERGERQVRPEQMAREWRGELAAQRALLAQDRWLGSLLGGAGLLMLLVVVPAGRRGRARAAA